MTKAGLISAVSAFINAVGRVTKSRHNNANDTIIGALYPATVFETESTTVIFTRGSLQTVFSYALKVKKTGNITFVQGSITNTSSTVSNTLNVITEVTNSEYLPVNAQTILANTSWGAVARISFLTSPNYVVGNGLAVPPNGIVTINGYYFNND